MFPSEISIPLVLRFLISSKHLSSIILHDSLNLLFWNFDRFFSTLFHSSSPFFLTNLLLFFSSFVSLPLTLCFKVLLHLIFLFCFISYSEFLISFFSSSVFFYFQYFSYLGWDYIVLNPFSYELKGLASCILSHFISSFLWSAVWLLSDMNVFSQYFLLNLTFFFPFILPLASQFIS